jgi:hypothetical protein
MLVAARSSQDFARRKGDYRAARLPVCVFFWHILLIHQQSALIPGG